MALRNDMEVTWLGEDQTIGIEPWRTLATHAP
jgi:hypothetical protein